MGINAGFVTPKEQLDELFPKQPIHIQRTDGCILSATERLSQSAYTEMRGKLGSDFAQLSADGILDIYLSEVATLRETKNLSTEGINMFRCISYARFLAIREAQAELSLVLPDVSMEELFAFSVVDNSPQG